MSRNQGPLRRLLILFVLLGLITAACSNSKDEGGGSPSSGGGSGGGSCRLVGTGRRRFPSRQPVGAPGESPSHRTRRGRGSPTPDRRACSAHPAPATAFADAARIRPPGTAPPGTSRRRRTAPRSTTRPVPFTRAARSYRPPPAWVNHRRPRRRFRRGGGTGARGRRTRVSGRLPCCTA